MKELKVLVHLFENGDRVLTPDGPGTVVKNEEWTKESENNREILVQLDNPHSNNTSNKPHIYEHYCIIYMAYS